MKGEDMSNTPAAARIKPSNVRAISARSSSLVVFIWKIRSPIPVTTFHPAGLLERHVRLSKVSWPSEEQEEHVSICEIETSLIRIVIRLLRLSLEPRRLRTSRINLSRMSWALEVLIPIQPERL